MISRSWGGRWNRRREEAGRRRGVRQYFFSLYCGDSKTFSPVKTENTFIDRTIAGRCVCFTPEIPNYGIIIMGKCHFSPDYVS